MARFSKIPSAYNLIETTIVEASKSAEDIQKTLPKRLRYDTFSKIISTLKTEDKIKSQKKKGKTHLSKKINEKV